MAAEVVAEAQQLPRPAVAVVAVDVAVQLPPPVLRRLPFLLCPVLMVLRPQADVAERLVAEVVAAAELRRQPVQLPAVVRQVVVVVQRLLRARLFD